MPVSTFPHGDYEEHKGRFNALRALSKELDLPVAAMLDTKGPEIRLGTFKNGVEKLVTGQKFTLTSREVEGAPTRSALSPTKSCPASLPLAAVSC